MIFKIFTKKKKSVSWIETFIEQAATSSMEQYFKEEEPSPIELTFKSKEKYSYLENYFKSERKKKLELKKQLFVSWCTAKKKVQAPNEEFEEYLKKFEEAKYLYRYESELEEVLDNILFEPANIEFSFEPQTLSNAQLDEFQLFLRKTLESINHELDHLMKLACSQGNVDKRQKFRKFCRLNIKSLDDTDNSGINTETHKSINLIQNSNAIRKYKWAC